MNLEFLIKRIYNILRKNNIVQAQISYLIPSEQLKGKKIIITGGGRGLGYAIAKKLVENGASVLIAGRNEEILKKSASTLGCMYLQLDLQNICTFSKFIQKTDEMLGGVNCLINNAGISLHEEFYTDVNEKQFDEQINTNFKGPFFLTQEFIRHLLNKEDHSGKIIFISSETGDTVDERPYGLTKAAINSLVQGLAYRYIKENISVNAISPGVTASDMTGRKDDGDLSFKGNMRGRIYLSAEIAEIACFLLSDVSNLLNGQILTCNEGKTINARIRY